MPRSPIWKINMFQADSCVTFINSFMSYNLKLKICLSYFYGPNFTKYKIVIRGYGIATAGIFQYLKVSAFFLISGCFWYTKFKEKNREEFPYLGYRPSQGKLSTSRSICHFGNTFVFLKWLLEYLLQKYLRYIFFILIQYFEYLNKQTNFKPSFCQLYCLFLL